MEENQENQNTENPENTSNFNINSEDLKKETQETVNQVKDTIKNVNIKKDSQEAKGFLSAFFKNPLEELRKVSSDSKNSFLKIAIIILVIWLAATLIVNVFGFASTYLFGTFGSFERFFKNLFPNMFSVLKDLIAPLIAIAVLSGLVYGFKKNKNKSFLTISSTIVVAKIPIVIATVAELLTIFGTQVTKLTSAFSGFCSILSAVLLYFAIKELSDEGENKSYFWKFALIIGIFYVIKFIFSYLGIYL